MGKYKEYDPQEILEDIKEQESKQTLKQIKAQKAKEKEEYKLMFDDCACALDCALHHIFGTLAGGDYNAGLNACYLKKNKNKIINHIGENDTEKRILEQIYYKEVKKIANEYKLNEQAKAHFQEIKESSQALENARKAYEEEYKKNKLRNLWQNMQKGSNAILIGTGATVGALVGLGIRENKKKKK